MEKLGKNYGWNRDGVLICTKDNKKMHFILPFCPRTFVHIGLKKERESNCPMEVTKGLEPSLRTSVLCC